MKAIVYSARGMGNVGDDLVSEIAAKIIKSCAPRSQVTFGSLPAAVEDVVTADCVVLGGGGLLYDADQANVNNYMYPLDLAVLAGKKTAVLGVGSQRITTDYGRTRYAESLEGVGMLSVRDRRDYDELKVGCGIKNHVHETADLAFLLPEYSDEPSKAVRRIMDQLDGFGGGGGLLAVSLVDRSTAVSGDSGRHNASLKLEGVLRDLLARTDKRVVFFLHSKDDEEFYDKFVDLGNTLRVKLDEPADSLSLLHIYRKFDTVLTSRYHAFILSLLARVNVVTLTDENLKIGRLIAQRFPSLRETSVAYDELLDDMAVEKFVGMIKSQAGVVDEDEINSTIVAAQKTRDLLRAYLSSR